MKNSKSLAIIGASGMVGSDLTNYFRPYFSNITPIDRKNYNRNLGKSFDVVINANGNSNKVWANENLLSDFQASTISVYKSLMDFPCKIYIYISSADVYPNHSTPKFTSELTTIDSNKLSPYGFHKYLSECIVKNFANNYIILRCSMMLGTKLKKGPVFDILSNSRLFVSPKSAYQMITTEGLSQIIFHLLKSEAKKEVLNIGGKGVLALNKISPIIKRVINFPHGEKTVKYEMDVSKLGKIYKLKSSGEYFKDLLKYYE